MKKKTLDAMRAHALEAYPRESCGLIINKQGKDVYVPCENHAKGTEHFKISGQDWANAEDQGEVIAVVHSHPDTSNRPSEADLVSCEAAGLPWFIVSVIEGQTDIHRFEPTGYKAPLIGRTFWHGVLDCYSIVRDYYERERGITLLDFERDDHWWDGEEELYLDNFEKAGFVEVNDLQVGDVILMQMRSERVNHAGVFLGSTGLTEVPDLFPVPDAMLHHCYGRLSERVVYGGFWKQSTRKIVRYR